MRMRPTLALAALALPLSAQAWDVRLEVPMPQGQNLPDTLIQGTSQLISQKRLDTGRGFILTASHRIIRVGPVLKFEWGAEFASWQADGVVANGAVTADSRLKQVGLGLGVNAQFWVPFTGLAGEIGAIERFQSYKLDVGGARQDKDIARPWLRVALRYSLPLPVVNPYLTASYQQPITKDRPVKVSSVSDLGSLLSAQGSGQEFERMWTFGVGIAF
ncbi:autotransporter outer membrane beta-barrel domain-containing protein [Mesoterricola sediminis]|uniref:Outer membrane protein beta-barrel domain-containing protein n=1 Tax=Mesoterricola sediminis TaxID=2927980 RepID=A0AA48H775_9BACT|nr:autotransporter outer membrane beta-barrel domain-containing protein [Mesoterricola sediminis]BDU78631.1 hypothetical protein METESE_35890 [Mesoterricola sediminis]